MQIINGSYMVVVIICDYQLCFHYSQVLTLKTYNSQDFYHLVRMLITFYHSPVIFSLFLTSLFIVSETIKCVLQSFYLSQKLLSPKTFLMFILCFSLSSLFFFLFFSQFPAPKNISAFISRILFYSSLVMQRENF